MTIEKLLENAKKTLKRHNQCHLPAFWEQLDPAQKQDLLAQIQLLDFAKIDVCYEDIAKCC